MTSFRIYLAAAISAIFLAAATSHVIGGGLNTNINLLDNEVSGLSSALSARKHQRRHKKQHKKPKHRTHVFPGLVHKESRTSFDTPRNPFLRNKRQALCILPSDLPQLVKDSNRDLNTFQFVGVTEQDMSYTPLPSDQPTKTDCPTEAGSWWPRKETNLRSRCPWVIEERDLGDDYFPRYVREAVCVCRTCVGATSKGCQVLQQPVTVFKREGCRNGIAVLTKQVIGMNVGCHCASGATAEMDTFETTATPGR